MEKHFLKIPKYLQLEKFFFSVKNIVSIWKKYFIKISKYISYLEKYFFYTEIYFVLGDIFCICKIYFVALIKIFYKNTEIYFVDIWKNIL